MSEGGTNPSAPSGGAALARTSLNAAGLNVPTWRSWPISWVLESRPAPGGGKQRATRDDRWILARRGGDGRPDAKLHECLDGVPCPHAANLELIPTRAGQRNKWGDVRILCDAIGQHDE